MLQKINPQRLVTGCRGGMSKRMTDLEVGGMGGNGRAASGEEEMQKGGPLRREMGRGN